MHKYPQSTLNITPACDTMSYETCIAQGLQASSLQFTSPLEFNAIYRDGFPLRIDLNGWNKIRDPVTAKFKHARLF